MSIAEPFQRIPLDSLAIPRRVRRALSGFWRLGDVHGKSRKAFLELPGFGRKSLDHLEEVLSYALGDGFAFVAEEEWRQPRIPGIAGRPVMELF